MVAVLKYLYMLLLYYIVYVFAIDKHKRNGDAAYPTIEIMGLRRAVLYHSNLVDNALRLLEGEIPVDAVHGDVIPRLLRELVAQIRDGKHIVLHAAFADAHGLLQQGEQALLSEMEHITRSAQERDLRKESRALRLCIDLLSIVPILEVEAFLCFRVALRRLRLRDTGESVVALPLLL